MGRGLVGVYELHVVILHHITINLSMYMMYRVMHQSAHPPMMLLSSHLYAPQNLTTETAFSTHYMNAAPGSSEQSCPWDEGGTASLDPS